MNRRVFREKVIFNLYQYDLIKKTDDILSTKVKDVFLFVLEHLNQIDQNISMSLKNYTIDRLSFVDRAIIRYAVYEMLFTDTPKQVIINEAIEITKLYTDLDEKQRAFTNRLLDNISKRIGEHHGK